ncbi:MAG: HAMP domain-containing sensor histidine kinase [Chromatiaceae bacterium]
MRWLLVLFFIALAIPSAVLTWQAHSRLQWESFYQYQLLAEGLVGRIDRRVREMIATEEARAFTEYRFLVAEGASVADSLQRSPLSGFPAISEIPGLLGYFQVDADGRFSTPLLPDDPEQSALAYGITDTELRERQAVRERLLQILSQEGSLPDEQAAETALKGGLAPASEESVEDRRGRQAEMAPAAVSVLKDEGPMGVPGLSSRAPQAGSPATATSTMPGQQTATEVQEQKLAQAAFERLSEESSRLRKSNKQPASAGNIGRVDELKLDQAFDADQAKLQARRPLPRFKERVELDTVRREQSPLPVPVEAARRSDDAEHDAEAMAAAPALVRIFESEVDPFAFDQVGSDYFVLYRKVWRDGQRFIQGAVIEKATLLRELVEAPYRDTTLAGMSRLGIVFGAEILSALGGQQGRDYLSSTEQLSGTLLFRGRLSSPLDQLELILSVTRIPSGTAGRLVIWVAMILGLVLSSGLLLMYRLGVKQIELNRQQQDFVSAVSHELKTPLTSIRMYSEMLREGWTDEARRRDYYAFINDESERLSRLISNVLQLARMSRDELKVELRPTSVSQLMDAVESKVRTQVDHAGFALQLRYSEPAETKILAVDNDAFAQIMINLVDNALKFSAHAEQRLITIDASASDDGYVAFSVRDRGPGIPRDQMKKIFQLFYRSENELTRETVGTGIGLALVHRLTSAMGGEVDVVNRNPGAEFRVRFPTLTGPSSQSTEANRH